MGLSSLEWPFGTPWSMAAYATFLQSFVIAAAGSLGPQWLGITWTLAVQEQFYLGLPWLLRCAPARWLGIVLGALLLMAPFFRFLVVLAAPAGRWLGYDFLICCRSDTLAVGVLAAWVLQKIGGSEWLGRFRSLLCPSGVALFLGFLLVTQIGHGMETPAIFILGHTYRAIMYLVVVLVACFASGGWAGAVMRWAPLRELGRISYGLFLFHQMVRDLLVRLVLGEPRNLISWQTWLVNLEAFVLTALLAEFCWHFVEKPLIAWSRRY